MAGSMIEQGKGYYCTHGPLIPLVSGYLSGGQVKARRNTDGLADEPHSADWAGGVVVVVGVLLLQLISLHLDIRLTSGVAFVLLCFGGVWTVWGRRWARELAFPLMFLMVMIPVPFVANAVTVPLQHWSASVVAMLGGLGGMPLTRDGLVLQLPNYSFEVAPACSGVNSLFSMAPLAVLLAHLQTGTWWSRMALVAAAGPIALVANMCRIVLTLVVASCFGKRAAEGFFHTLSGLVLFSVGLAGLLLVTRWLVRIRPGSDMMPAAQ